MSAPNTDGTKSDGLYAELKRRNVFRVAAAYIVLGWLTLQVADVVLGFTGAPEWVGKTLIALLLLGFVPALGLAWVFEVDSRGIHVDDGEAPATEHADPATHASRLDMLTLGAVFFVVVLMAWQHLGPGFRSQSDSPAEAPAAAVDAAPAPTAQADTPGRVPFDDELVPPSGSIAVLPFTNRSAEPDTAYFVDGVHDDLLTELARNPALTVISRTSVLEYRDTTKNLRQIGDELGVAHVMEGAVQRAGQRVRINAQLIDARTDAHLWAETFDRELKPESVFEIQSEIARAIASALNSKLGVAAEPGGVDPPTRSPVAYEAYLRARQGRESWARGAIDARIALYRQAVEADPDFAVAMAELGREYANRFWYQTRRDEDRRTSREWIDRALALRPDDPVVRLALAEHYYRAELDWEAALAELGRAEEGLPGSAELVAIRGYVLRRVGKPQAAIAALLRAARLDPRSWTPAQTLFETYLLIGRMEEANYWASVIWTLPNVPEVFRRAYYEQARARRTGNYARAIAEMDRLGGLDLPESERALPEISLAIAYGAGDWTRLSRYLDSQSGEVVENQFRVLMPNAWRARMLYAQGDRDGSRQLAEAARKQVEGLLAGDPDDYRLWIEMARAQALLGRLEASRAAVDRALANPTLARDALIRSEVMAEAALALAPVVDSEELAEALRAYLALPMHYWSLDGLLVLPELGRHREHPAIRALANGQVDDGGRE
ncbi:hypothetical protein [Pseudomarimonas salicorniae]|uniref:TolB amino-terminal domain-containing protein n=1 Tax=Pseudomarimonas salicorniae TaxID=2933270 RepID=A0ABT0GDW0_9GAMM|nr:hypothetical protein [Lysobacter sp. CAU 1642]MCK7592735.1 hypothetical protein [Lysobacter sp. CAU 1642]